MRVVSCLPLRRFGKPLGAPFILALALTVLLSSPASALVMQNNTATVISEAAKAKLAEGQKAFEGGKMEEALTAYSESIKLAPQFDQAYYHRGILLYQQNKKAESIADFTKVIERNPKNADAYYRRGLGYISFGSQENYDKFFADQTKAIELNRDFLPAYKVRAITNASIGNYDTAISDFNQVIRLEPEFALNYFRRGTAYYDIAYRDNFNPVTFKKALKDFDQSSRIDPKYLSTYGLRAQTHSLLGNKAAALADCDTLAELSPQGYESSSTRGAVFLNLREYAEAAQAYEKAIIASPKTPSVYFFAGVCYALLQQDDKALARINTGISLGTKSDARRVLAWIQNKAKRDPSKTVSSAVMESLKKASD
jgi:tetratricopeptide (TPR) repeat protein